jgi:hypothetical protein
MGRYLPDRSSGVFWHLLLPETFSGLGLWIEDDIPNLLLRLPAISRQLLIDSVSGTLEESNRKVWKSLTSNCTFRGYEELKEFDQLDNALDCLIENMSSGEFGPPLRKYKWSEVIQEVDPKRELSSIMQVHRARQMTFMTIDDIREAIKRPFLFKAQLGGEAVEKEFNTIPLKRRFSRIWEKVFKGDPVLDEETLRKAIAMHSNTFFIKLSETVDEMSVQGGFQPVNIVDEMTIGLPNLTFKESEIGSLY